MIRSSAIFFSPPERRFTRPLRWRRAEVAVDDPRLKPRRIAEIGVRYGYSIKSFVLGSLAGGTKDIEVTGWDNESYAGDAGCLAVAEAHFAQHLPEVKLTLNRANTANLTTLGGPYDLIHVDGDHSEAGSYRDLGLAWAAVADDGHVLFDDVQHWEGGVNGLWRFMKERKLQRHIIPMTTVAALIPKNQKGLFPVP